MTVRLTAGLWVAAYLNRLRLSDISAYIMAKGDATAGAVLVKVATMDGQACVYERHFDLVRISVSGRFLPKVQRRIWTHCCNGRGAVIPIYGSLKSKIVRGAIC